MRLDLKRKYSEVNDGFDDTIQIEDDVEDSRSNSINDGDTMHGQKSRISLLFSTLEFESRNSDLKIVSRTILFSKPRKDSFLDKCGLTAILEKLHINSLVDIPRVCYSTYIVEFYTNLNKDGFDNYISVIKGRRLLLKSVISHSILKFNVY